MPVTNLSLIKLMPVIHMNGQFPNQSHLILLLRRPAQSAIFAKLLKMETANFALGSCPRAKAAGEKVG